MAFRLMEADWPEFGGPAEAPLFSADDYRLRLARARQAMAAAGYSHLMVYGDREHFANLFWLCGMDPRFEEALLILSEHAEPLLLTGIECQAYVAVSPLFGARGLRQEHFRPFSLPGITTESSRTLAGILAGEGVTSASRVGCVGWKAFDLPAYLVDELRQRAGSVADATPLFSDPETGLRRVATAREIAWFEYANVLASDGVARILRGLRTGATDYEMLRLAEFSGVPQGCHWGLKTGPHRVSLASPRGARLERGQPFSTNICYWGANCCRAGWLVASETELPGYVSEFAGPYFETMGRWFAALAVGRPAGGLHAAMGAVDLGIRFAAGHLMHWEEWFTTPVWQGSPVELRAGMVFQSDVIPSSAKHYSSRMEDSYALVDATLEAELAREFPALLARCRARREFMRRNLGLRVDDSVLPLSNLAGMVPPYLLRPELLLALES
jgi:hypothetical protein